MAPLEPLESTDTFPTTSGLLLIDDGPALIGHGWAEAPATHSVVARWNVGTGTLAWQGTTRLPCQDLALLADEPVLACASSFGLVEMLSVENGTPVGTAETQQGRVSAITALSDGRRSVTASAAEPTVGMWDTAGGSPVVVVETASSRYNTPLWYSPDGQHVVGVAVPQSPFDVSEDGGCSYLQEGCFLTPDLIDGETGAVVDSLDGILGAAWFGDVLAYVASDGSLGLLDVSSGTSQPVDASSLSILGEVVDYDPVHQRSFYWVDDGTSYLMDASSRRFVRSEIPATPTLPRAASFTGDGERLEMVSNGELSLVDVDSGELLAGPLPGFDSVDAQGDLVVAGDRSGRVHVLDARSLDPVRTPMSSGSGVVQEIEISNGLDVVMARSGDAVRLFNLGAGEQLGTAIAVPRADNTEGAALRPDGKRLAVTAEAGLAIWNLDPSDWYRAACQLAGRDLTRNEWDTHIGDLAPYHATCDERS
jgi:WD40 repeat protein